MQMVFLPFSMILLNLGAGVGIRAPEVVSNHQGCEPWRIASLLPQQRTRGDSNPCDVWDIDQSEAGHLRPLGHSLLL